MRLHQTLLLGAQLSTILALPTKPQDVTGEYTILAPDPPVKRSSKAGVKIIPANAQNAENATARVLEAGGKNATSKSVEACTEVDNMPAAKLLDTVNEIADDLQNALCVRFTTRDSALEERSGKVNETLNATDNMSSAKSVNTNSVDELASDLQAALDVYFTSAKSGSALEERTGEVKE